MTRFYELREDPSSTYTGYIRGTNKWGLPGSHCPVCEGTTVAIGVSYPTVDLSGLAEESKFREPRREPIEEYERLRELVRPLLPPGALLRPGSNVGPLTGTATGRFGSFFYDDPFLLVTRREALELLRAAGLNGLEGGRAELRFRQRAAPELWELQLQHHGRLHPDCLPANREPPCQRCGSGSFTLPDPVLLDAASLPVGLDLFRLCDATATVVASERFVEAVRRLALDGVTFKELPHR
ncbi:double-CXXCG motif protein [Myxococcaceae bacterium GXIMD 01537]